MDWIERMWDQAEQAIRDAYTCGRDVAQEAIRSVSEEIKTAASELGEDIKLFEEQIRERLDTYFRKVVDAALGRVRSAIRIGNRELVASSATIKQTLRFTGTINTKLEDICSFVSEGQLAIEVSYTVSA
jgi:hypothetical protein